MDEKKNLFRDTRGILDGRSQSLDTDLPPIEPCLVHVGETSRHDRLPQFRKPFALYDVGSRQDPPVTTDTLESGYDLSEEIAGDRNVIERLIERLISTGKCQRQPYPPHPTVL